MDNIPNENQGKPPIQNFAQVIGTNFIPIKTKIRSKRNGHKLDGTDLAVLNLLANDATTSASEMAKKLRCIQINMSERGIRKRIKSLQKHGIIKGFTVVLDDDASGKLVRRFILVKFRNIKNFRKRLEDYTNYVIKSPYCIFAVRLRAEYDWFHFKCFPTKKLADLEDDVLRAQFGDIMEQYRNYDAEVIKSSFNTIVDSDSVLKYIQKIDSR